MRFIPVDGRCSRPQSRLCCRVCCRPGAARLYPVRAEFAADRFLPVEHNLHCVGQAVN